MSLRRVASNTRRECRWGVGEGGAAQCDACCFVVGAHCLDLGGMMNAMHRRKTVKMDSFSRPFEEVLSVLIVGTVGTTC